MGKIRVYELSKETGVTNKDIILAAKELGLELKSHASAIEDHYIQKIKEKITNSKVKKNTPETKEEVSEEVKVFKSETGQEVVERRTGSKVVLRKKRRVKEEEKTEEPEVIEEMPEEDVTPEADNTGKEIDTNIEIAAESSLEGSEEAPDIPEAADVAEIADDLELKEDKKEVTEKGKSSVKADDSKKKKKAKKVKITKEEIIDEDTLEELRKAFRTKLPTRKKEYVVDDRKFKPKSPAGDNKGRHGQRNRPFPENKYKQQKLTGDAPTGIRPEIEDSGKKHIKIGETVAVGELAKKMGIKGVALIRKLMQLGMPATINEQIDAETATIVAEEYGHNIVIEKYEEEDFLLESDENETLVKRPPVVTVMGHVDHGKTTLLDSIRTTSVVTGEAGGITQHIGAYKVVLNDSVITFIDTPGHEAFTSMRARGASITDIVILVVAADDGVMPQTLEAINHAKAAEVPIIVAVNKIDKDDADPEKIKRQLSENGLISEEWGGDTLFAEVSAKSKQGIKELLDLVLLQADILELQAVADKRANGVIVEAKLDKGRGAISTVIVTEGTLKIGDYVMSGIYSGRVKALKDDQGRDVKEAGPSIPVEIMGISGVPTAGERFYVVKDEKTAKEVISNRELKLRKKTVVPDLKVSLEQLFENLEKDEVKELFIVIKGDTQGSVEALQESLLKLNGEKCTVNIVHAGVGGINETDIVLASASNAIVVGFNVRPDSNALKIAEKEGVSLELHKIIYDVTNRITAAMEGLLEPVVSEVITAHVEVKETFHISKIGTIAGCMVTDGKVQRDNKIRVIRDSVQIYEGDIDSLRRFKDDVKEVQSGFECGISVVNFNDIKEGDTFEIFKYEETKQQL